MAEAVYNKVALVTGANKGIGFEIARQLGKQGITVLVGVRNADRGKEAVQKLRKEGFEAHQIQIDVTDEASIGKAAATIADTYGHLDILINNAGISRERGQKPSETSVLTIKETFETNVFGVVAVTNAMLPLLRRSEAGRIVNLSSSMGSLTFAADPTSQYAKLILLAYNSSKAALNSVTLEYAKELRGTPIKINAVSPGYVATDLNQHKGYLTPEQGATAPVRLALIDNDGPSGTFQDMNGETPW
jgi:NAD(P)-dependent dehydrogenase (short-subunit alcohol dehydrogenase family)